MVTLLWGTYPAAGLGTPAGLGEGIWAQAGTGVGGAAQVLDLPAPSFLLAHPRLPLAYAASELPASTLTVLDVSRPASPRIVASLSTGGADACHLLLAPDARTLYVSHYSSGDLAVVRLGEDGLPVDDAPAQSFSHAGSGPNEDRQEGPHAHSAVLAPGGGTSWCATWAPTSCAATASWRTDCLSPTGSPRRSLRGPVRATPRCAAISFT
ncbi:hypothetical protein GCM10025873_17700 [Demequina sediminis]|nr:hypothetical protein GCM10025873_17700 [Demequina sediminis]